MKARIWGIFGIAFSILNSSPVLSAEVGWSLDQRASGGAMNGAMTIYVSPTGMRTYDPNSGISLMTHGPNWQVFIFNDKTKRIFQSPLQPWLASFKQRNLVGRFEGASWKRGNPAGAVAGVRAYEFVMDHPPPIRANSKTINGKAIKSVNLQSASLWVASDIQTPQQVSEIIGKLYGVPDCQRFPLRLTVVESGRGNSTAMDTVKVKRINLPDNVFAVPHGYQPVKQDADVFVDQETMDTLDEMLQDIDSPSTQKRRPATQAPQRPGTYPRR